MNYASIFNEVWGPVMVGISSSHTAGPHRIGQIARMMTHGRAKKIDITFDPGSSYAALYKLQWSDHGWAAGLMGIPIDSDQVCDSLEIAESKKVEINFIKSPKTNTHANYADLELTCDDGDKLTLGTLSLGGAAIEIIAIDNCPISYYGDFNALVLYLEDCTNSSSIESRLGEILSESFQWEYSESEQAKILFIKTREEINNTILAKLEELPGITKVRSTGAVLPVMSSFEYEDIPFSVAEDALAYAKVQGIHDAGELGIRYEMARSGYSREQLMELMKGIIGVMRESIERAVNRPTDEKIGGLYDVVGTSMFRTAKGKKTPLVDIGILSEVSAVAVGVLETIELERPGAVVASPTVGSVGTIPAAVVYLGDSMGFSDDEIAAAMFAAGSVGVFVAHQACFGGEVLGCQAECGAAAAMASAGIVQMLGGSAHQAYMAAGVTLQNVLGLICDPVSVGYEPCNSRNIMAVSNAISVANMVMCGFKVQIPLDEVIETMKRVGEQLPVCLKGTYGGLCCTKTGNWLSEVCG